MNLVHGYEIDKNLTRVPDMLLVSWLHTMRRYPAWITLED